MSRRSVVDFPVILANFWSELLIRRRCPREALSFNYFFCQFASAGQQQTMTFIGGILSTTSPSWVHLKTILHEFHVLLIALVVFLLTPISTGNVSPTPISLFAARIVGFNVEILFAE